MHDEHPHPLLAQVPLTVSPFLNLPTATPLPYTYKQLPSTLPPSILSAPPAQNAGAPSSNQSAADHSSQEQQQQQQQPAYIVSSTGTTATPDAILTSCIALQQHLAQLESTAQKTLREWEDRRQAADLAEKRRVAPGWLDNDVHLLKPENVGGQDTIMGEGSAAGAARQPPQRRTSVGIKALVEKRDGVVDSSEGEALDRAFGGMDIK